MTDALGQTTRMSYEGHLMLKKRTATGIASIGVMTARQPGLAAFIRTGTTGCWKGASRITTAGMK
ncbi:hypothetical protein [Paenibacillus ehimensis]|uniref:hypothetical protein n=1 Tax=Paenibacillus ehimensis TaxID=79264 RepID=UPI001C3F86BA